MLFNTIPFLVFFPVLTLLYFLVPIGFQRAVLLSGSCIFYMCWIPEHILLIAIPVLVDYWMALKMSRTDIEDQRWRFLKISVATNLGLLFLFKYADPLLQGAAAVARSCGANIRIPLLDLLLPAGISFYTFQTLSYSIDVYRRSVSAEPHLGIFALFIVFFPHLVAGPIMRSADLLPQFRRENRFSMDRLVSGLKLILWGLFKKIAVADRIAHYVTLVYGDVLRSTGLHLLLATYFFAVQIYCDFSGYSDIAVGCAKILGFNLMDNFRQPYFSQSIPEFWTRWHISLSNWIRDYIFFPLSIQTLRIPFLRSNPLVSASLAMLVTMGLCGLWHGARWNFIVWGIAHGLLLALSHLARSPRRSKATPRGILGFVRVVLNFQVICMTWVLFRAPDLATAQAIFTKIFFHLWPPSLSFSSVADPVSVRRMSIDLLLVCVLAAVEYCEQSESVASRMNRVPFVFRLIFYELLLFSILLFGTGGVIPFIYFQF